MLRRGDDVLLIAASQQVTSACECGTTSRKEFLQGVNKK